MKRLIILTGATGGIGSEILSQLETQIQLNFDADICCLGRKCVENVCRWIQADFGSDDNTYIDELKRWVNSYGDVSEILLILAASIITPIDSVGKLGEGRGINNGKNSIEHNISINVISQVKLVDAVVNVTKSRSAGLRIIQLDSGAAYRPVNGWALYCSAKAYMSMFLKVLSREHPDYKMVLVDPGVVDTGMQEEIRGASSEAFTDIDLFRSYMEDGKLNKPKLVAEAVINRYVTAWKSETLCERYVDFR